MSVDLAVAVTLHLLAALIWVGGMFFAILVLRPASGPLEPPDRLALWRRVFGGFFPWVWLAVAVLLVTGYWMIFARWGGLGALPLHAHLMHGAGWLMALLYLHLWFGPYRGFKAAFDAGRPPDAAACLDRIRRIVTANLALGLATAAVGASGRYW